MNFSRTRFIGLASFVTVLLFVSHPAYAAGGVAVIGAYLQQFITLIDVYLVPIIFALAFLVFIWGIFQYFILGAANEEKRDSGKQLMIWGLLGFFVMISVWGIINLLVYSFGFGNSARPTLPTFGAPSTQTTGASNNQNILNNLNSSGGSGAQTGAGTAQPIGTSCTTTAECGSGMECIAGSCHVFGDIVAPPVQQSSGTCQTDSQCPSGQTCQLISGTGICN